MTTMNYSQARIIDPVLTQIAQGIKQQGLVGSALFPQVNVNVRGGKVVKFGREQFMAYATERAFGANTARVQFGYTSDTFALVDYRIEGALPVELQQEAMNGPISIDLATIGVRNALAIMALRLEKAQAAAARNAANYDGTHKVTLSGTSQWSNLTASDPVNDVEAAKDAIRSTTGQMPNTLVMGPAVLKSLRQHSKIIDRVKYTGRDVPTPELLASLFGVDRVIVGSSIAADDAGTLSDVWGKDVVLAYTDMSSVADMGSPSFGYTYNLNGYPLAEVPYLDRNANTWAFPVSRAEAPVIASPVSGYLISAAVA